MCVSSLFRFLVLLLARVFSKNPSFELLLGGGRTLGLW